MDEAIPAKYRKKRYVVVLAWGSHLKAMTEFTADFNGYKVVSGPYEAWDDALDALALAAEDRREEEIAARRYVVVGCRLKRTTPDDPNGMTLDAANAEIRKREPVRSSRPSKKGERSRRLIEAAEKAGVKIPASWKTWEVKA